MTLYAGCWVARVGPLHFLAGCHKTLLNQDFVVLLVFDEASFFVCFLCFRCVCCFVSLFLVVSTSAVNCLGRLVSEMTYYVSSGK